MWIYLSLLAFVLLVLVLVPVLRVLLGTLDSLPRSNDDWFYY